MPLFLLLLYRCAGCGATPNPHGCAVRAGICSGWLRRRAGGAGLCYIAARRVPPAKGRGARCCRRHWSFHTVLLLTPNTCAAARTVAPLCTRYRPICTARSSGSPFIEHALPTVFFNGMRRAVGLCGQCWQAGRRHGTIRSEQIFFSDAETLCPPGSLSQCKALQKQTKENAPCAASKLLSWIKTGDKTGPRPTA